MFVSLALRRAAIAADGRIRPTGVLTDGRGALDGLAFSLREAPLRRPLQGLLGSVAGSLLVMGGFVGLGRMADRGLRLREWGRRLRAVDGRALLRDRAGEPPVLLLRSFDEEEMRDPRPLSFFMPRYEETLSRVLGKFGPVITIGRPGDELGFLGAGRLYVSDREWQQAVRHFMCCAGAVVIIVGRSEGLWWEIREALAVVPRERLLFVFPHAYVPERARTGGRSEFYESWNLPRRLRDNMGRERTQRYEIFRQRVGGLVAEGLPQELGDAICLDFTRNGRVRLLDPKSPGVIRYLFGPGTNIVADLLFWHYRPYRFDMARTLWPFVAKLYETTG